MMLNKESLTQESISNSIYMKFLKRQNQSTLFKVKILANFVGKRQSLEKEHGRNSGILVFSVSCYDQFLGHRT